MNTDWNFDKTGKRMPYTMPADFPTELETDIWQKIAAKKHIHHMNYLRTALRVLATAAAVVSLIFVLNGHLLKNGSAELSDIATAFNRLSVEDQNYLLETYQDDFFINQ